MIKLKNIILQNLCRNNRDKYWKNGSVSTYEENDGLTKSCIIKSSKLKYLITEKSKIEQDGNYIYSNLNDFDYIIIDSDISNEIKTK